MFSKPNNQYSKFMKEFLDLPEFFKFVKSKSRGELYALLPFVVKEYNKNWDKTLNNNSYMDLRRFVSMLKVYNVKHDIPKIDKYERKRKFIAQMFASVSGAATKANVVAEKVDGLVDKLNGIVDTSGEDIKKIFSNLSAFTNLFVPSDNSWYEIIMYMVKFASLAFLMSQKQNQSVQNIVALLVLILPTGVGDCIISSLNRAIQGIWTMFKEKTQFVAQSNDSNIIISFFQVTIQLFTSVFKNISMDMFKDMQLSVNKLKMISDYLRSSSTIFEYILKLFEKCVEVAGNKILKYYGKLPKILQEDSLNDLIDRYVHIKEHQLDIKARNNSYNAKLVVNLYNDALKAQAKLIKTSKKNDFGQSKLIAYLNIIVRNLESTVVKIPDHIKGTKNARRTKPFWIYIYGEPRIGKTSTLQPYIINKIAHDCGLVDSYQDYSEYTYFRNCGDEYWEKYCGQPVLWYNDLFQVFTNEQKVNVGIEELTNVIDDNLYPLNMAFEEKHAVYFDSQLVISNAQDDICGKQFISNKCLSEGFHLNARRNVVIRLRLNPTYRMYDKTISEVAINTAREQKVPFLGDLFPQDMYFIDFMDTTNGMLLKTAGFEEAMNIIVALYKRYKAKQENFKEKLFDHFKNMWVAQGLDEWQDAVTNATRRTWSCTWCEQAYDETSMLLPEERHEFMLMLQSNCPHKTADEVSRWKQFGETVKVNVVAFKDVALKFLKNNAKYLVIAALVTLIPYAVDIITNYFGKNATDPLWMHQSAEATIKRSNVQVRRFVAQEYNQQNKDIETKVSRNMGLVSMYRLYEGNYRYFTTLGSCLGVGGDVFLMPKHFVRRFQQFHEAYKDDSLYIQIEFTEKQTYKMPFNDCKVHESNMSHMEDIAFVQMPKMFCLSKMDKYFVSVRDEPNLFGSYLFGKRLSHTLHLMTTSNVHLSTRDYLLSEVEIPFISKFIPSKRIVLPEAYEFSVGGVVVGDCGMLLMNVDEKLNSRKIMGMHVAGTSDGSNGLASTLYREDILEAFEAFGTFIAMDNVDYLSEDNITSNLKIALSQTFPVLGAPLPVNDKKVKLSIPMKTNINKSVFFDVMNSDFGPNKFKPAQLRPFRNGDEIISPLMKGLQKMVKTTVCPSRKIILAVVDHMYISIMDWTSDYVSNPRLLTDSEMVNGCFNLNKIDISTSPGFPYQLKSKSGGKRDWITYVDDKLILNEELMMDISKREQDAQNNIITPTYFIDTLKDETRPIEKVDAGKTRVFQVGPMGLSLLMRKYFGFFIMHCQATYINGEMAIGINPNSYDWTLLIKRMLRVSNKFINGDYSDYDASMSQPIMMEVVEVINKFYKLPYDHVDNVVRRVLFATFLNNVHIVEDCVFMRLQGNMSGIALTTIVNCLYNMFLLRYAYYILVDTDFTRFGSLISATFYGDDNLVAVHDSIIDKFNMKTYFCVMDSLNITYTTSDKQELVKNYYTINEIQYLKRTFNKRQEIYYAQLDYDVLLEIPRWSESNPNNMMDQINRFNCVLYESVNYGFDKYKYFLGYFREYCMLAKSFGYSISITGLLTYAYILRSMFPQFFNCDLTKELDQALGMLDESGSMITDSINRSNLTTDNNNSSSYKIIMETMSNETKLTRSTQQVTRQLVAQNYEECRDKMDDIDNAINFKLDFEHKMFAMSNKFDPTSLERIDENAGETVRREQVTTTFDDTIPHITEDGEIQSPHVVDAFLSTDLDVFVKREWYISQLEWTSDYARGGLVEVGDYPDAFFNNLRNKIENIAYWAPDFEIIFKVNGTPMHYGRIFFVIVPSATILHEAYLQALNCTQNRFAQISPTGNQSVILKVPWMHYYDRQTVSTTIRSTVPWRLYAWCGVPLTSANSATVAPVTVSIYGRITNPRFCGYTNSTTLQEEMVAQSNDFKEQDTLSKNENCTAPIGEVGIIPLPSEIARKVSVLAGDMSQVAAEAGFGVPPNLTATKPVQQRGQLQCKAEDLPLSIQLAPSLAAGVRRDDKDCNGIKDGMMLSKVAGRMSLLDTRKISTPAVGDNIYTLDLSPTNLLAKDYSLTPDVGTCFPLPAAYLARLCRYWRGSFKFHISFVCSAFHSLRVRMSYAPGVSDSNTAPNAASSGYLVNEVWDVNNQTDYSFTIPFIYWSEWLKNTRRMGTLYITALTKLTSSLGTPQPIYMQVWCGMDTDFQLASPAIQAVDYNVYFAGQQIGNPDVASWVGQSNDRIQSGNPLLNYRTMQFPAMSSDGLTTIVYPVIGGKESKRKVFRVCTSWEFSSVREFANMLTPVDRVQVLTTVDPKPEDSVAVYGRGLNPFGWVDKGPNDNIWFCYLYQIMAMFRYVTGGVRFSAISDAGLSAQSFLNVSNYGLTIWYDDKTDVIYGDSALTPATEGMHVFREPRLTPPDVIIPYYAPTKCLPIKMGPKIVGGYIPDTTCASIVYRIAVPPKTPKGGEVARITFLASAGDSLQFGYQMPIPRCRFKKKPADPEE
jgi:hypothetical protein